MLARHIYKNTNLNIHNIRDGDRTGKDEILPATAIQCTYRPDE